MEYRIITMENCHLAQVAELEKVCFSDPWPLSVLENELTNPLSLWLVAVSGETVLGYVGSQSVLGESDMMNLAVREGARRQGIAGALVSGLCVRLREAGNTMLTLEVRASNASALALYEKLGFYPVGLRPRYYVHPVEDARILRKDLTL